MRPDFNTDSVVYVATVLDEISQNSLLFKFHREGEQYADVKTLYSLVLSEFPAQNKQGIFGLLLN